MGFAFTSANIIPDTVSTGIILSKYIFLFTFSCREGLDIYNLPLPQLKLATFMSFLTQLTCWIERLYI